MQALKRAIIAAGLALGVGFGFGFGQTAAVAGVMLGAHVGADNDPSGEQEFEALEAQLGHRLAIDNDHEDWTYFPRADRVRWDVRSGRLPMLSWRIIFHRNQPSGGCATADAINGGAYDAQLARQASAARALATRVLVRFNYEMTSNEENTCFTGFVVKDNPNLAGAKYVAAWRHVVDIFRKVGATNVEWVWAPGHTAFGSGMWRSFWPGGDYVDWIGVDYYNKPDVVKDFAADRGMQAFYAVGTSLRKPLMVAETGAINDPRMNPDPQTAWLLGARSFLKSHPAIRAFLWWDTPGRYFKDNPGYGGTGYLLTGAGLAAFKAMADDPYFQVSPAQR